MQRRFAAVSLTCAAVVMAAASPAVAASSTASLSRQLTAALASSGATALSVRVDIAGRGTVYTRSSTSLQAPASTEKLITAYSALRVLGPSHRFVTTIGSSAAPSPHGVIHGRLVVTASGDPTLTFGELETLAKRLRARDVRTVTGGILLDDTLFSRTRRAPGWKPEWVPGEVGPLSAFAVDGNDWRADPGYLANPSIGNLQALQRALAKAGIQVHGPLTVGRPAVKPRPQVSLASAPLSSIVHTMLKRSVNFDAEMLLEDLGAARSKPTIAGGVQVIRAQAAAMHVSLGGNIVDGSGLSGYDRQSADGEVTWLEAVMRDKKLGPILYAGLPVSCDPGGTLTGRLCQSANPVHAKTGTLDGMRALSGFVTDAAGHRVTFSFLIAGPLSSATRAKNAIDAAVTALSRSH